MGTIICDKSHAKIALSDGAELAARAYYIGIIIQVIVWYVL